MRRRHGVFFACEEDSMTSVDSNFNFLCGRPHGAGPPSPSTCVHLSLTPSPLRVDVINGWPHIRGCTMHGGLLVTDLQGWPVNSEVRGSNSGQGRNFF